jgi:hypothetical protein
MSANARTISARPGLVHAKRARAAVAGERRLALGALAVILLGSLVIVVMAANRPSFISATSHTNFFPRWMAGPLGGIWPSLTRSNTTLRDLFSGSVALMYAGYVLGVRHATALPVRLLVGVVLAVHLVFFLSPPLALTDVFNYINYARMEVVHQLNPYASTPVLEPHSDPAFALSNWHHLLSPYGPLFTLLSFAIVPLGVAGSFWAFKGILMAASLGTLALVYRCAQMLDVEPRRAVLLVGLNPVVLVWGLGGDHNDFLMVFCIVLAFYLLLRAGALGARREADPEPPATRNGAVRARRRPRAWILALSPPELAAGGALVAATALKASAGILLPVVLAGLLRSPRRAVQVALGMLASGVVVGAASLLAFGAHLPDLTTQGSLVTMISIPNLIGLALGQGGETNTLHTALNVVLAGALLGCCVLAYRRREPLTASGWATVALLVTLGWVLPWYVLWVLPLAAFSSSRRLRTVALVLGAYLIVAWAPVTSAVMSALHLEPSKTALGRQHQRLVKQLLN